MASLNTMDFVTMLPRNLEAGDAQGRVMNQQQHAAEQTEVQFQAKTQQEAQQPVALQKSETQDYDGGGQPGGGATGGRNRKPKKKAVKEAPMAPRSNSSFDITI